MPFYLLYIDVPVLLIIFLHFIFPFPFLPSFFFGGGGGGGVDRGRVGWCDGAE